MNRSLTEEIISHIDFALQQQSANVQRNYLGASRLGVQCDRALQYDYWKVPIDVGKGHSGQTYRRFAMGHVFEELALQWLTTAGFTLQTKQANGEQYHFSVLDGRLQGHIDGIITAVPPGVELACPSVWEHKALNNKSWRDLAKQGVTLAHPIYAAQIALYQAYMANVIPPANSALLMATNKETAELYFELVPFNAELAQRTSDRAVNILQACEADEILPRITRNQSYYVCRVCQWQSHCWKKEG